MAQIGLFFGSDEGNTESVAYRIQQRLGSDVVDVFDVADVTQLEFAEYDKIILGISTWDFGQIQSDWEEFWGDIEQVPFAGKTVALFGLGDQFGYGDFFYSRSLADRRLRLRSLQGENSRPGPVCRVGFG